jgi:hypothetical protein
LIDKKGICRRLGDVFRTNERQPALRPLKFNLQVNFLLHILFVTPARPAYRNLSPLPSVSRAMRCRVLFFFALMWLSPFGSASGWAWVDEPAHAVADCVVEVQAALHTSATPNASDPLHSEHGTVCHSCPAGQAAPLASHADATQVRAPRQGQPAHHARAFFSAASAPDIRPPIL